MWWLFTPAADVAASSAEFDETGWDEAAEPDPVYITILDAMRTLSDPRAHHTGRTAVGHPARRRDST